MDIETLKLGLLLFFIPGIFIWFPLLMWYCVKQDMKKDKIKGDANEIKNRAAIEAEMKKPFYVVRFKTNDGTERVSADVTPGWDEDRIRSGRWFWLNTAEQEANKLMKFYYEKGYFRDNKDVTYPTCNVLEAKIEVVSGT